MSLWGDTTILLASKSPRRRQLVQMLGVPFKTIDISVDETLDHPVEAALVAQSLAELKADGYCNPLKDNEILLTADTTVVLNNTVLGKPRGREEAFAMLSALSGHTHEVYTGVCLKTNRTKKVFSDCTKVVFRPLSDEAIRYYIDTYRPVDKAGAYGIQEWIGLYGVESIEGCYYNVMGLPVARICREISELGFRN